MLYVMVVVAIAAAVLVADILVDAVMPMLRLFYVVFCSISCD